MSLIYEGKLNPWDVDLDVVVEEFLKKIRAMKELDLHIPGNIILAASILLKYKSLSLIIEENGEETPQEIEVEISPLIFSGRIKPARPITINELMSALEKSIEEQSFTPKKRKPSPRLVPQINVEINEIDIERKINELSKLLVEQMDEYGIVKLSDLLANDLNENVVRFLALLHMEGEGLCILKQEIAFGEVLIQLNKEKFIEKAPNN